MAIEKNVLLRLRRYVQVFKDARERGANESDTVMYLVKFFEDILGYDSLSGEISKEVAIKDRYCDLCIKLGGVVRFLIEAKAAGNKILREKDIEQAENYASRSGINWVLLTNGVSWQLFHLSFAEGEGIAHELVFEINLVDDFEAKQDEIWNALNLLSKESIQKEGLEFFWQQKKVLAPASLVRVLFSEPVLTIIRRELNRTSAARLELSDVFCGVRDALSKEALLAAGDIDLRPKRRRRRRRVKKVDATTGQTVEGEVETDEEDDGNTTAPNEPTVEPIPSPAPPPL